MAVELPEDYRELVSLYFDTRAVELSQLADAISSRDFAAVARIGHNLQGSSASFGFDEAHAIGRELEAAGSRGDAPAVGRLAERLHRFLDGVEVRFIAPAGSPSRVRSPVRFPMLDRELLIDALEGSMLAVFDWDVAADEVRLSATWPAMLGGAPGETRATRDELLAIVHPDDVDRVASAAIDALRGRSAHYDVEHRVRRFDGSYIWIHSRGKVTARDPEGRALRFSGTNADITARVVAEQRLKERELQLHQLIDTMPAAIVVFGPDERMLFHNRTYTQLMNLPDEDLTGRLVRDVIGAERYGAVAPHMREVLAGRVQRFEQRIADDAGRATDFEVVYTPLRDAEDRVTAAIAVRFDITHLKDLDRMKDRFVAVASHELRTPLAAMRGSLGLLQGGVAGELPEEARSLVDIAVQNCERLVRMADDLLDLEKMAAGQMAYRIRALDWNRVLAVALESSRGFIASHGVRFELKPHESLRVRGDEDRLIQVLSNLLFNAAKFSPRGSVVTVSAGRHAPGRIRTSVRDHGPGIPESFRARVFQRFAQADTEDSRATEGTGLGLAISREIVERLGGRIGFDAAQGGGTVFWFDLPEATPARTP